MSAASVAWISIAPVKGLGLVHPAWVALDDGGVASDRRFHVIDERGRLINGKHLGVLVQVRPDYDDDAQTLALAFPDGGTVAGEVALGEPVTTVFYGRPVRGRAVVGPWNDALSAFAGRALKLIRSDRPGASNDRGRSGSASLLSRAALEAFAPAVGATSPLDARRFRMLFGIDGIAAYEEDGWIGRDVRVGEAVVRPRGHCGRCLITGQDPDTGVPDLPTLDALREVRGDVESTEPLPFGVIAEVVAPGRVALGDPVEVS